MRLSAGLRPNPLGELTALYQAPQLDLRDRGWGPQMGRGKGTEGGKRKVRGKKGWMILPQAIPGSATDCWVQDERTHDDDDDDEQ